jgi:acyl-coenzyme A thioesterase PaaI-like protein
VRFGQEHVGAPGLVLGGLLATLADEVMGSVGHGGDGVRLTAEFTIRYRRPVAVERDLVCRAGVGDSAGRRYAVVSVIVGADDPDVVLAEAEATFVLVDDPASAP